MATTQDSQVMVRLKPEDMEKLAAGQRLALAVETEGGVNAVEQQIEHEHGILNFSHWWERFNNYPAHFDIDDHAIYLEVARSYMSELRDEYTDEQLPPQEMLKMAAVAVVNSGGRKTVEKTVSFMLWRSEAILEGRDQVGIETALDLDARRKAYDERVMVDKEKNARIRQGKPAYSLLQDLKREWALDREGNLERANAIIAEAAKKEKARLAREGGQLRELTLFGRPFQAWADKH